jgi:hypothetical protein
MRNKKIVSAVGAIALTLGIGMNLQYSLDDYGMTTNTLSNFVWAQSGSSWWGGTSGTSTSDKLYNHPESVKVHCKIITETTTSGGVSGGISAGVSGGIPGGVSGGISAGVSGGSSSSTTTTITEEFDAIKIICYQSTNLVETCTSFNPCEKK